MKTVQISIQSHKSEYQIHIGSGLLENIETLVALETYSAIYIITDSHVAPLYLSALSTHLLKIFENERIFSYVFQAGESSKTIETVQKIYEDMADKNLDRHALVINLGGGVVTDLGGYAAATFMRGLPCINISTTLEGMVDASVGGKTGVNLGHLKNYIGAFVQPKAVIIDIQTLKTLSDRILLQGYAEVVKHGLIADQNLFEDAVKASPLEMSDESLIDVIERSVKIKARLVQEDEKEHAARKLLNFGHTIGHALESRAMQAASPLYHGEAVSIGMVAEAHISYTSGMISKIEFKAIEQGLRSVGLPTRYEGKETADEILSDLSSDKKNEHGKIRWTLLSKIGTGEFNIAISEKFVRDSILYIRS